MSSLITTPPVLNGVSVVYAQRARRDGRGPITRVQTASYIAHKDVYRWPQDNVETLNSDRCVGDAYYMYSNGEKLLPLQGKAPQPSQWYRVVVQKYNHSSMGMVFLAQRVSC